MNKKVVLLVIPVVLLLAWFIWNKVDHQNKDKAPSQIATSTTQLTSQTSTDNLPDKGSLEFVPATVEIPAPVKELIPGMPPNNKNIFHHYTDFTNEALWMTKEKRYDTLYLWHASTGTMEKFQYADHYHVLIYDDLPSVKAVPQGLLLQGGRYYFGNEWNTDHARLVLLTRTNEMIIGRLNVARDKPQLHLLSDGTILAVGGITSWKLERSDKITRTNAVERILYSDGKLVTERLPDLPGEVRRDVSIVQMADGNVLVSGGSTSTSMGSQPMTDKTYIFDLASKSWHEGPKLTEPRSDAVSVLLPDGTVLVMGGWTPTQTWQEEASRTTEQLKPGNNQFTTASPLPVGMARHQVAWVEDKQKKKHLLLLGGIVKAYRSSNEVHEYDLERGIWLTKAEGCAAPEFTQKVEFALFNAKDNNAFIWCHNSQYSDGWRLLATQLLTSSDGGEAKIVPNENLIFYRPGSALVFQQPQAPVVIAGGSVDGAPSAAVESISADGRIEALGNLNYARIGARIFRLNDGSLLVSGGHRGRLGQHDDFSPPLEWLPGGQPLAKAQWQQLDMKFDIADVVGQLKDGSLLKVQGRAITQFTFFRSPKGGLEYRESELPPLNRERQLTESESGPNTTVMRELPDGRIILAGGSVEGQRIAVLQEDSLDSNAVDEYVGLGGYVPARSYEVYTPKAKAWIESALSRSEGGWSAILDDGRVVKWGRIIERGREGDWASAVLEVSSSDGRNWSEWREPPQVVVTDAARPAHPFVVEGELFLSGKHAGDKSDGGATLLQWFNTSSKQWETVWEGAANEVPQRELGRILVKELANGKRVVLPMADLREDR